MVTSGRRPSAVPLGPEELLRLLRRRVRYGLRASRLLDCPELVNFLVPDGEKLPTYDRAILAEGHIGKAIASIGGKSGDAIRTVTGLEDGTVGRSLQERRELAGKVLSRGHRQVNSATFAKHYEPVLLRDLAVELWRNASAPNA